LAARRRAMDSVRRYGIGVQPIRMNRDSLH
jgi:hypothetical protein